MQIRGRYWSTFRNDGLAETNDITDVTGFASRTF
jgi:hypothetical protein